MLVLLSNIALAQSEQKIRYYNEGRYQYHTCTYAYTNPEGIIEKITVIDKCVADCIVYEVWYKSSNAIHKIKLEIIDDSYTWDDMIKVKFTGSDDSYELLFTYIMV